MPTLLPARIVPSASPASAIRLFVIACCVAAPGVVTAEQSKLTETRPDAHDPKPIAGARLVADVPYLDATRDTVSWNAEGDDYLEYRTRMNVYIPKAGEGPLPVLVTVHGGSYTGGYKDPVPLSWFSHPAMTEAIRRGYVVVSINYILGSGIHPQIQRDFKECIRHLRAQHKRYRIDRDRIAAIGASAGGWLVTSAGFTTADNFGASSQHQSYTMAQLVEDPKATRGRLRRLANRTIMTSFDEPTPRHPRISARLTAIVFDFSHQQDAVSDEDGALLKFKTKPEPSAWQTKRSTAGGITEILLTKGGVHMPDDKQQVATADGKGKTMLYKRVLDWLDKHLAGEQALTPAAEARPNHRFFADTVDITFATTSPDTAVYYTLDGSKPTLQSPRADGPVTLKDTSTVRFIAKDAHMPPSGVAQATFIKGEPLPEVTGPKTLPAATVGEPYEVTFKAEGATYMVANLQNQKWHRPHERERDAYRAFKQRGNVATIGLDFDKETGRLHGTPDRFGTFVLQIAARREPGNFGGHRTWVLTVTPKDKPQQGPHDRKLAETRTSD
jgi:hypothetical protein